MNQRFERGAFDGCAFGAHSGKAELSHLGNVAGIRVYRRFAIVVAVPRAFTNDVVVVAHVSFHHRPPKWLLRSAMMVAQTQPVDTGNWVEAG